MRRVSADLFLLAIAAVLSTAQPVIATGSLPNAVVGQTYPVVALQASGTVGSASWSLASGSLPSGFVLLGGGSFCVGLSPAFGPSCTPGIPVTSAPGPYTFTIQATDLQTQLSSTQQFTIVVVSPVQISSLALPSAFVNQPYTTTLQASGGAAAFATGQYLWTVALGSLPFGFTLDQITGAISSDSPSTSGSFPVTIQVNDIATTSTASKSFTLNISSVPLQITSSGLPSTVQGIPYQTAMSATGGFPPYTWGLGTNNQGLNIGQASGVVSGTPQTAGSFFITISLQDSAGSSIQATLPFQVIPALAITLTSLSDGEVAHSYSQTLTAAGGTLPYIWSIGSGALPQGLTLNPTTGVIQGSATVSSQSTFTAKVADSGGLVATAPLSINIVAGIAVTTTSLPFAPVGRPYSLNLASTGGLAPISWSLLTGSLPAGIVLNSSTGLLSGTPTASGATTFTISATDRLGVTAQQTLTLTPISAGRSLSITGTTSFTATLGTLFSVTLTASGGTLPLNWSSSAALPPGLALSTSGTIQGIPTAAGSFSFTVQVTDSIGANDTATLSINVGSVLTITASLASGVVGTPYSQTLTAAGGTPPYTWSVSSGALPVGLQLNNSTGAVTGTPTVPGTINTGLQVNDSVGRTAILAASITITLPASLTPVIGLTTSTQPAVSVTIGSPFPNDITGTLHLSFVSSAGGTDNMIRFTNGALTLPFQITAGATQASFPNTPGAAVISGTVAGTITVQVTALDSGGTSLLPSAPPIKSILMNPAVPAISSVSLQQVSGGINVIVIGYSNTREVLTDVFHFNVASGNTLSQADITVPLTAAYTTWFSSALANATGGQFMLTMPFAVTQGTGTAVTSVQVTLTNAVGSSIPVTSP